MKKIITLLMMLMAAVVTRAAETVLWEGTYQDGVEIGSETVATFKAGNVLRVYATVPESGANFKIVYKGAPDWSETTIPSVGTQWPWMNGDETYKDFTLTADDITALEGKNIYVYKGDNSEITKLSLITAGDEPAVDPVYEGTVIYNGGAVVMGTDWSQYIALGADKFESLYPGATIRVYIKDVLDDVQAVFQSGDWQDIEGVDAVYPAATDDYYELVMPKVVLDIVKEKGLIIKGKNFTAVAVTITETGTQEEPEPSTPVFNEEGIADLSKFVSDGSAGYSYADGKGTITATNAWTGVYLLLPEGQYVSGQQLTVKFETATQAQIHVCYVGKEWGEGSQLIETGTELRLPLTETEQISRIDIQLVADNSTAVLTEVSVGDTPAVSYPIAIWAGEQVIDWSANPSTWQTISKDKFAQVKAGDILRMQYKDVKAGAQMGLQYSVPDNWALLPGVEIMAIDGMATRLVLTQEMLDAISSGDLHITGVGFTLTKVEVLDPATAKTLVCSVPVTGGDWIWNAGETPSFTLHVQNNNDEAVTAQASLLITTDKMEAVATLDDSRELAAHSSDECSFSLADVTLTPGFYRATVIVNDETVRAFNFGYAPTEIASPADKQSDFESYWQAARDELAAIEAADEPVLTKIDAKSTDKRTVYLVEFKSVSNGDGQPVTVRGYYAEPNDGKKHPVIMHYQGYDSNYRPGGQDATPWCLDGDGDEYSANYAEFVLSTRGQSVNNRPAADRADGIDRDFTNEYGDWFAYNFGDKDKYYYRGAYMDCVRAIDFMASRPTSDMTNLYAEGQSQGGAFTYAAAALSGREFKAIAPGIAFMGDFPDYFELANWPAEVARANQGTMTDAEMFAFLSYFDTKNLATLVSDRTAVIATIGVQDNVCPPHTNIAPYNNLAAGTPKEISFNPENGHQVAGNWYEVYMQFFASKYVEPQPTDPEPATPVFNEQGIADLSRIEVQDAEKVTYDASTHTVTTTEGWTGVQLTVSDGEEVSGKELRVSFDRAMAVKCYVKYTDGTDADVIMDQAADVLYFPIDAAKCLYQLQLQPTEAATFVLDEIAVNPESTKPVLRPLEEGEVRTLFEDEEGVVMAWNEICQMDEEWGGILETGEQFYVTVKERIEGSEWPKVILRNANSEEVSSVELGDVTTYPYIVKMVITEDMVAQLRNGFRFSGDGVSITKIELSKPAAAKEGDVSITAMNWFRTAVYDAELCMMTTTSRWGQAGWEVGDERYADKTLIIVNIEPTTFPVTLKLEYENTSGRAIGSSVGIAAGKTQLNLPLPLDTKVVKKVYLTYKEAASIVLTDASVISAANARPETGDEPTGIDELEYVEKTETYYSLSGQRVMTPTKGLYILNGKVVIVK